MPPLLPIYSWSEDERQIKIIMPLKGNKVSQVDLFVSERYIKINFGKYLLELDLKDEVDDETVQAIAKEGNLSLILEKRHAALWTFLTIDPLEYDKESLLARRINEVEQRREKEQKMHQKAKEKKLEKERIALKAQMALEERARERMDHMRKEEKQQAEAGMYSTLLNLNAASPPFSPTENAVKYTTSKGRQEKLQIRTSIQKQRLEPPQKEHVPASPPGIRAASKVRVKFTSRIFPTPVRASKLADEEDWIARHRPHLFRYKSFKGRDQDQQPLGKDDPHDFSDSDPVWLKNKGDKLYRAGDHQSALNAFSAALEREPDHACEVLSNRASCLLKLDRLAECIADCTKALAHAGMFNERPQAQAVGRQDLLRLRLHVKRGTAYFRCKEYQKALDDYRAALTYSSNEEDLAQDVQTLQVFLKR